MHILLGVTGGIAAYKSAVLVSRLVQANHEVSVIMTRSATRLVCPKTFEALSHRPVQTELFAAERPFSHIDLGREADLLCVAPASANFLGKTATGIADDFLSTIYLSFVGPVLFAPAMNAVMWEKAAVRRNVQQLLEDGVQFIGPETGRLGCGEAGIGRMSEPEEIFERILQVGRQTTGDK